MKMAHSCFVLFCFVSKLYSQTCFVTDVKKLFKFSQTQRSPDLKYIMLVLVFILREYFRAEELWIEHFLGVSKITFSFSFFPAKSNRKLTFLYLANDVIQNSKRKGPEFTREFESVLVDAFSHVARYVVWAFCLFCLVFKCITLSSLLSFPFPR